jgi:hypothetical protein
MFSIDFIPAGVALRPDCDGHSPLNWSTYILKQNESGELSPPKMTKITEIVFQVLIREVLQPGEIKSESVEGQVKFL